MFKQLVGISCLCLGTSGSRLRGQAAAVSDELPKCNAELLANPKGYMLDLDGTVFNNRGWLKGAPEIFTWFEEKSIAYSLLTNGFKTGNDVVEQLKSPPLNYPVAVDPTIVHTAGIALARYLEENAPKRARIFLIGGDTIINNVKRSTLDLLQDSVKDKELFESWRIRSDMTMDEIYEWSHHAHDHGDAVFVVVGNDLHCNGIVDPVTKKKGYTTLDFDLIAKMTILLRNRARLIMGSSDVLESRQNTSAFPTISTDVPSNGALEQFLLTASNAKNDGEVDYHVGTGKGGNKGAEYMIEECVKILQAKNPDSKMTKEEVVMIGDNLGTDILAANQAGVKSIFVLSGVHKLSDLGNLPGKPTCYLNDLSELPTLFE